MPKQYVNLHTKTAFANSNDVLGMILDHLGKLFQISLRPVLIILKFFAASWVAANGRVQ